MSTAPQPSRSSSLAVRIIFGVVVVLALLLVSVRFDWEQGIMRYLQDRTLAPKAQLTVTLSHGQGKVLLDGKEMGRTPVDVTSIPPGKGTLQITRDPNPNNFYSTLNIPITLVAKSQTVVVADLGPSYDTSSFWVSYIDDRFANNNVYIETIPSGSQIAIEKEFRGQSPLPVSDLNPGTYTITISHEEYQELTTTIQIVENKTVFVSAKLYKSPVLIK